MHQLSMKDGFYLMLLAFLVVLHSCKKEEESKDLVSYSYAETQCADPWHEMPGAFDRTPTERVSFYLESEEIEFSGLISETYGEGMLFCAACDCASGIRFTLTGSNEYESSLNSLGFQSE